MDFDERERLLRELADVPADVAVACLDGGGAKQWLLHRLLRHRQEDPAAYQGQQYEPLEVRGARGRHVVAFARERLVAVVPRLVVGLADGWGDTEVLLPQGRWRDVLTGRAVSGGPAPMAELVAGFPVAVLAREDR